MKWLDNMFSKCSYLGIEQYKNIFGECDMDATRYLKDSLALLGLFGVIYLWSVVAYALQA